MSLEGSLETVALPEVLQLLSDTSKSGELLVRGDRGDGRIWFGQGRLTAFQVARTEQAADALFDLLRNAGGRFSFEADAEVPEDAPKVAEDDNELRPILELAQARLAEWTEIVAVIPSLRHIVRLAAEAPRARLHLDSAQWELVVAVGEGRTVEEILDRASLPEFDGCKSLKVLVNSGLAEVSEPAIEAVEEPAAEVVEEPAAEVVEEPVVQEPVAEVAYESVADEFQEPAEQTAEPVSEDPEVPTYEAPLDPHEYVFSAPSNSESAEPLAEEAPGEVSAWSLSLADGSVDETNHSDHDHADYVAQHVPYPEVHDDHETNGSNDARAVLEALIAEIPAEGQEAVEPAHESPDGLADRGPWTSNELDQMSSWHQDEEPQEVTSWGSFQVTSSHTPFDGEAHAAAPVLDQEYAASDAEASDSSDEDQEPEQQPEQVNRGLLLKFLSSVRS